MIDSSAWPEAVEEARLTTRSLGNAGLFRPSALISALTVAVGLVAFSCPGLAAESDYREPAAIVGGELVPDVDTRVIGGTESQSGAWPSVVALMFARPGFSIRARSFCGGTVIDERWVLTAAHCVFSRNDDVVSPASLVVGSGMTDMAIDIPEETVVTNIITHPQYDPADAASAFDIALLELATSIDVPVVPMYRADPELVVGQPATVIGWGSISSDTANPIYPTQLRQGYPPIVSQATCNEPKAYNGAIADNQICAGLPDGGLDSCAGDSGGPLMVQIRDEVQQIGLVSYGFGCAEPNKYGVYTSVSAFDDWLAQFVALTPAIRSPGEEPLSEIDGPNVDTNAPSESMADALANLGNADSGPLGLGAWGVPWLALLALIAAARRCRLRRVVLVTRDQADASRVSLSTFSRRATSG